MTLNTAPTQDTGFSLQYDAERRLVLVDARGRRHVDVEPIRCFPVSHPNRWIAICDAQGHELTRIDDLTTLADDVRKLLAAEIERREFVPVINRIVHLSDDAEYSEWQVETDRGATTLRTQGDEAVRRLDGRRVMLVDASGIRYLIPDSSRLDRASRLLLDRFI